MPSDGSIAGSEKDTMAELRLTVRRWGVRAMWGLLGSILSGADAAQTEQSTGENLVAVGGHESRMYVARHQATLSSCVQGPG